MSGDSLFAGSIGRTDFPTGSMTDLISNLKAKILTLDENLTVFPIMVEQLLLPMKNKSILI